jgi:hypothetical protein
MIKNKALELIIKYFLVNLKALSAPYNDKKNLIYIGAVIYSFSNASLGRRRGHGRGF